MTSGQEPPAVGCVRWVSYVEAEGTGGWFADMRGLGGRLIETGFGATKAEALEHLRARLERAEPEAEATP
jgi:hypothetical protein